MRQANDLGKPYAGKLHVRFDEGVKEVRTENVGLPLYRLLLLFYSTIKLKLEISWQIAENAHDQGRSVLGQDFLYSEKGYFLIALFNVFYGACNSD